MTFILNKSEVFFSKLENIFEGEKANKIISKSLVLIFLITTFIGFLVKEEYIYLGVLNEYFLTPFFSIELCFVILLMFELLSLIFILPKSVSKSVGKQLELLSLIFIRGAFKEFSHLKTIDYYNFDLFNMPEPIVNMVFYSLGSLIMFILLGLTNKLRTNTIIEEETKGFIQAKKLLSLFLFFAFIIIVSFDLLELYNTGKFYPSFTTFYTILIYSDILIVLIALRYTTNYFNIFRYSAFVVATIFIRLSLSLGAYYDVIVGVFTTLFVLLLTIAYSYYSKFILNNKLK